MVGVFATRSSNSAYVNCLPRRGLFLACIALIGLAHLQLSAHQKPRVRLQRDAGAIGGAQSGNVNSRGHQSGCAFEEHESHRRPHQLHRRMRARGDVASTLRVAISGRPRLAIRIENSLEFDATQLRAMNQEIAPALGPRQIPHRLS